MWTAIAIFALTYAAILAAGSRFAPLDRPAAAVVGAVLMVAAGVLTPLEVYRDAVDHATLVLLLGTMILTGYLGAAGFFRFASHATLRAARTPRRLLVAVALLSAALSAFIVNDTVCLFMAPLVLQLVDDAELPPLPYLFAVAFGANAGSAATPTGNPQNMIVATLSGMPYATFTAALLPAAAVATAVVVGLLLLLFRRELSGGPLAIADVAAPTVDRPLLVKTLLALGGVVVGFLAGLDMAFTALAGAAFLFVFGRLRPTDVLASVDWLLLLFFAGLFVVVHGLGVSGAADVVLAPLSDGGADPLRGAALWAAVSIVASNLLSNVPFVLLAAQAVPSTAEPLLTWQVLALASTLAGNLTLVGSVANLIVFGAAGARGKVPFTRFLAVGAPVTLLSTAAGLAVLLALR